MISVSNSGIYPLDLTCLSRCYPRVHLALWSRRCGSCWRNTGFSIAEVEKERPFGSAWRRNSCSQTCLLGHSWNDACPAVVCAAMAYALLTADLWGALGNTRLTVFAASQRCWHISDFKCVALLHCLILRLSC